MLPLPPEWAVLDVGCGLGILDFELAINQPSQIVAVDIEPGFVGTRRRSGSAWRTSAYSAWALQFASRKVTSVRSPSAMRALTSSSFESSSSSSPTPSRQ